VEVVQIVDVQKELKSARNTGVVNRLPQKIAVFPIPLHNSAIAPL